MADDIDDISIDLNTDIPEKAELSVKHLKNLKNELKATKDAMAGVEEGSEAFTIAAEKAGKLNDKIKDISEGINAQTGEPIERVAGSFALLGDKLRSLDFKGASVQLANVASGVKSIDFKEILTGMKAFGTQMLTLGAQLLLNPIFLIVATLAAIGVAFYKLRDDARESINDQIKLYDQLGAAIEARYDREIRIAKSAGQQTSDLEIKKLEITKKRVDGEIAALTYLQNSIVGLNEDQEKMLDGLFKKQQELAADRIVFFNQQIVQANEATKKNIATAELAKEKTKKLLDDAAAENEKRNQKSFDDKKKLDDDYLKSAEAEADRLAAIDIKKGEEELARKKAQIQNLLDVERQANIDAEADAEAMLDGELQRQVDIADLKVLFNNNDFEARREALQAKMDQELANEELTEEQKALIKERYRKLNDDLDKEEQDRKFARAQSVVSNLQNLSDLYFAVTSANLEKGSAKQKAEAKKQFNINKGLSLATATISGIQGVIAAYTSGSAIPIIGAVAGPAYAVLAGIAAAANIAKIASAKFDDGGGGAGATVTASSGGAPNIPEATSSPQAIPNFSQFQQNSTGNGGANNTSANGTTNQQATIKAYVVSQEITDQQTANNYSNSMGSL